MPFEKDKDGQTGTGERIDSWQGLFVRRGRKRVRKNRRPWTVAGSKTKGRTMPVHSPAYPSWCEMPPSRCGRFVQGIVLVPAHLVLEWRISVPPPGEFHASAKFFMLMLPHFFRRFLTTLAIHTPSFLSWAEAGFSPGVLLQTKRGMTQGAKIFRGITALEEVSRKRIAQESHSHSCEPCPRGVSPTFVIGDPA